MNLNSEKLLTPQAGTLSFRSSEWRVFKQLEKHSFIGDEFKLSTQLQLHSTRRALLE